MKINIIESNSKNLEVRSSLRTVFEPKTPDSIEIRDVIRKGIQGLTVENNEILIAEFTDNTGLDELYDIENVLFYNIGTGRFAPLTKNGLVFLKKGKNDLDYAYNYKYSVASIENYNVESENPIACLNDIIFDKRLSNYKATSFWQAFKQNTDKILIFDTINEPQEYGFSLEVKVPKGKRVNFASIIKPLLDGLISALHASDFSNEEAKIISDKIGATASLITDNNCVVLWKRKFYKGRAWNPADEYCTKLVLRVETSNDNKTHLSGQLFRR